jgi:hypothetical protein
MRVAYTPPVAITPETAAESARVGDGVKTAVSMVLATTNHGAYINIPAELPTGHRYVIGPAMWAGGQLNRKALHSFLGARPQVQHVIRLDGERRAEEILTIKAERKIVETQLGRTFQYFNIEGTANLMNETALAACDSIMDTGAAYVHCRNGRHRAMLVLGRYYVRKGYTWATIIDLLDWHDIQHQAAFAVYVNHLRAYYDINSRLRRSRTNFS